MSIGLIPWINEVNEFMKSNNLNDFMYNQLPDMLKDKSMLQRARHRGYIKQSKKTSYILNKDGSPSKCYGDRRVVWGIVKGA